MTISLATIERDRNKKKNIAKSYEGHGVVEEHGVHFLKGRMPKRKKEN